MRCPKWQAPLDSSTRRLCVTCIGRAIKSVGENTHTEAIHDAKLNAGVYGKAAKARERSRRWKVGS